MRRRLLALTLLALLAAAARGAVLETAAGLSLNSVLSVGGSLALKFESDRPAFASYPKASPSSAASEPRVDFRVGSLVERDAAGDTVQGADAIHRLSGDARMGERGRGPKQAPAAAADAAAAPPHWLHAGSTAPPAAHRPPLQPTTPAATATPRRLRSTWRAASPRPAAR